MKTTSLKLSKKLYEAFPEWNDTYFTHQLKPTRLDFAPPEFKGGNQESTGSEHKWVLDKEDTNTESRWFPKEQVPAYDTDFLLDKLPTWIEPTKKTPHLLTVQPNPIGSGWNALYRLAVKTPKTDYKHAIEIQEADTPAEALGNLALALKEKGLL